MEKDGKKDERSLVKIVYHYSDGTTVDFFTRTITKRGHILLDDHTVEHQAKDPVSRVYDVIKKQHGYISMGVLINRFRRMGKDSLVEIVDLLAGRGLVKIEKLPHPQNSTTIIRIKAV